MLKMQMWQCKRQLTHQLRMGVINHQIRLLCSSSRAHTLTCYVNRTVPIRLQDTTTGPDGEPSYAYNTFCKKTLVMSDLNMQGQKFYKSDTHSNLWRLLSVIGGLLVGIILPVHLTSSSVHADEPQGERKDFFEEYSGFSENERENQKHITLQEAIHIGNTVINELKANSGAPGVSVAVSVDGKVVWATGLGFADVENQVPCTPKSVFRVASISKTITMAAVAKLWEQGHLDLDKPVQYYVPEFPEKTWQGRKVTITTRQLISHLGGIRHYDKKYMMIQKDILKGFLEGNNNNSSINVNELLNIKKYDSVIQSLDIFKNDPLVTEPGTTYYYTSHGWNLVSAVVERAARMPFRDYLKTIIDELGMGSTHFEEHETLIPNRGRQYVLKSKDGGFTNARYVDVSYKWGSEGILSNVLDLVKFGNVMLDSSNASCSSDTTMSSRCQTFLKPDTVKKMWTEVDNTDCSSNNMKWCRGMCWDLCYHGKGKPFAAHTGLALGGLSALLISPGQIQTSKTEQGDSGTSLLSEMEQQALDQTKNQYQCSLQNVSRSQRKRTFVPDSQMEQRIFGTDQAVCGTSLSPESKTNRQISQTKGVVVSIILNVGHSSYRKMVNILAYAEKIAQIFECVQD